MGTNTYPACLFTRKDGVRSKMLMCLWPLNPIKKPNLRLSDLRQVISPHWASVYWTVTRDGRTEGVTTLSESSWCWQELNLWGPKRKKTWCFHSSNSLSPLPTFPSSTRANCGGRLSQDMWATNRFCPSCPDALEGEAAGRGPTLPWALGLPTTPGQSPRVTRWHLLPSSAAVGRQGRARQANSISGSSATHFQKSSLGELVKRPLAAPGVGLNLPLWMNCSRKINERVLQVK